MALGNRTRLAGKFGVFAILVLVEVWLARRITATPTIKGYADTAAFRVSSPTKGLVRTIVVTLGQPVTAGQVIAEMDGAELGGDLEIAMAKRKKLLGALRAAKAAPAPGAKKPAADPDPEDGGGDDEAPSEETLHVVDLHIEQLIARREALRLRAPIDGVVESIDVQPGDSIGPEVAVATVVTGQTNRIVACVPESRVGEAVIGASADVISATDGGVHHGVVESLTPAVTTLPARCQPSLGKIPSVGRLAVITVDGATVMPGQSELIEFHPDKMVARPPAVAVGSSPAPIPIQVPPEIESVSRVEASGLVWVASLDRFVVVSDQCGLDNAHRPWLFTMSRHGTLDPEPMVVEDVNGFDDVESIAAGDNGSLWLMSSQSVSDKGNRPPARELLMRLDPTAGGYHVGGVVHFAELLDAAPPETRAALHLRSVQALDIEGLAWRGGALYIGLKAPVDDSDRAAIWRVGAPDKLLAGDLAHAEMSVWGQVTMVVKADGHPVPAGIADMTFVSDSELIVGATSSLPSKTQVGAVFVVSGTGGELTATPLATFPGLRPEGVALSPTPGQLTVVFDRGKEVPEWLELDLPSPRTP